MICKEKSCGRRAHSRGWCTTHYRRWRTGKAMDAPIREYVGDLRGGAIASPSGDARPRREKPWVAEYALLHELGLYDENRCRIQSRDYELQSASPSIARCASQSMTEAE